MELGDVTQTDINANVPSIQSALRHLVYRIRGNRGELELDV